MEKLIAVQWEGADGSIYEDDAVVEFVQMQEENEDCMLDVPLIYHDIVFVYLPDGIPRDQKGYVREQAVKQFHNEA